MEAQKQNARFDTRITLEQKMMFEKAARVGGFRSLTDFIILTVQERARQILEENEKIIATQRDSEIFFDAILNPEKPNNALLMAAEAYKNF